MNPTTTARRDFMKQLTGTAGAAWLAAQWPSIATAAQHAHATVTSKAPVAFEVLTPEQAKEVIAIAARIIPTDDEPGATEAGVVYFIDRALKTFASESRAEYQSGLTATNELTSQMFPGVPRFSAATPEQQDRLLTEMSKDQKSDRRFMVQTQNGNSNAFFHLIWGHTLLGFLADPDAGGNRDYAGWKVIGRDPAHIFSPPFGYYDLNYPGWQPENAAEAGKK